MWDVVQHHLKLGEFATRESRASSFVMALVTRFGINISLLKSLTFASSALGFA